MLSYEQQANDLIEQYRRQLQFNPQPAYQEEHTLRVNGREGAMMVNLAPNSDKLVLDQNADIVWLVITDSVGCKTVTPFDISKHKEQKEIEEDKFKSFDERLTKLEEAVKHGKPNYRHDNPKFKPSDANTDASIRGNAQG